MKKLSIVILALFGVFLLSSTVFAWDDLIRCESGATIAEPGTMAGNIGIRYGSSSDMYDKDSEKQELADTGTEIRIPLWADYVVMNNLKAFAIVPIVSMNKYLSVDGKDNTGIGDIWLGAKYAVMPEGLLTVRGALDLPVGSDEKGLGNAGGFGIDIAALTSKKMDKIGLSGGLGVRWNAEGPEKALITKFQPGIGFYLNGMASYAVTEQIPAWLNLTYFNQGDGKSDGNDAKDTTVNWLEIAVGAGYKISDQLHAIGEIEYKVTGTNTQADFGISVVLGYRLPMK
ncbi:transporter [bacterium]|nr:transporter [bacterium]